MARHDAIEKVKSVAPDEVPQCPCSPTQIIDRMLYELHTSIDGREDAERLSTHPECSSPKKESPSSVIAQLSSPSHAIHSKSSTDERNSNSRRDCLSTSPVHLPRPRISPSLRSQTPLPTSSTPPRTSSGSSLSTQTRRSLGYEFGLRDFSSEESILPADESVSYSAGSIGYQDSASLDADILHKSSLFANDIAVDLTSPSRVQSEPERKIVIIEMDEEEDRAPSFKQIRAMFESKVVEAQNQDDYDEQGSISTFDDRTDAIVPLDSAQGAQRYIPQGYLETLAEVTEEPTMILCSLRNGSEKGDMTLLSPIRLRPRYVDDALLESTPTSTPTARGQVARSHLDWAHLHGLGTPSTLASSSSLYGWADVIASSTRSLSASPSNIWLSPMRTAASPMPSPAQMMGMKSAFWLTSPPRLSLQSGSKSHGIFGQAGGPQAKRRSIDQCPLGDDSEWVDAALDEPEDMIDTAAAASVETSSGRSLDNTKRAKPWKRISSRSASAAA